MTKSRYGLAVWSMLEALITDGVIPKTEAVQEAIARGRALEAVAEAAATHDIGAIEKALSALNGDRDGGGG